MMSKGISSITFTTNTQILSNFKKKMKDKNEKNNKNIINNFRWFINSKQFISSVSFIHGSLSFVNICASGGKFSELSKVLVLTVDRPTAVA